MIVGYSMLGLTQAQCTLRTFLNTIQTYFLITQPCSSTVTPRYNVHVYRHAFTGSIVWTLFAIKACTIACLYLII
jgi:hypothetical protein